MSRSIEELKNLALYQKLNFQRTVTTEVHMTEEGALSICKLLDNYHDMEVALLVDRKTYEIKDVAAVMHRHPFEDCIASVGSYRRLIGIRILGGGVMHRIHQLIPRVDGCSHLYTALEACLRALFIGAGYEEMTEVRKSEDRKSRQEFLRTHPLTKDTCVSFRTDGKLPDPAEPSSPQDQ